MSMPSRRAVVITALPIERTAVIEHLRDVNEEPPLRGSIYRRGVFDERSDPWEVIVAEIGAGNEGAAAEAERILSHYKPDVAMFVGVAGAIKDLSHGDVVAATKVYNYEAGKDRRSRFETRPETELSGYSLLQRARHEAGEPHWRERIRQSNPGAKTAGSPEARVGPIAAGPKVLASKRTATFKFIRTHYSDAVAVEMEGHGFLLGVRMNHPVLGLVVRGISDRVGDKNPDDDLNWQPIAARHAAAFAFQLLAKYSVSVGGSGGSGGGGSPTIRLDQDWQEKHLRDATATAGPRYSLELRVGTPLHDVFEALCTTSEWLVSIGAQRRKLSKLLDRFLDYLKKTDGQRLGIPSFPDHLREVGSVVAELLSRVDMAFDAVPDSSQAGTPTSVAAAIATVLPQVRELYANLRSDFEAKYGEGLADSASFRQFQAEYQMAFPAANLDGTRDLVTGLEELDAWARSGPGRVAGAKGILLVGGPGVGKTHGICDIAQERARRGLRTVVLFGEQFNSGDEPWERIRQLLGFGPMGRDDVLSTLDAAGAASHLLFCIDGLNESRPRAFWRDWLASVSTQIDRYPHIRLCVSCRSTYEAVSIPEGHGLSRVEHHGFSGLEFSACRQFFSYYGLEPPVAPSFHPEFSNPLFLHLACRTLKAAGIRKMPSGWHGLNTALNAFLREKNKVFALEHDRDERERIPQRALQEFMTEVERTRQVYLRWSEADSVTARVRPLGFSGPSVLEWLVRAGLLIADGNPADTAPDAEDVVRVAFERLGDHLFAARILANIKQGDLTKAIESGPLKFAFANPGAVLENQGLVEALSIQVPEHGDFSFELVDALPMGYPREQVLRATISALPWRDPQRMTGRTQEIALEGLTTRGYGHETFDKLLAIAAQETGPDALWLHCSLSRQHMPGRDGFLCGYLHDRIGVPSAVEQLLRAPFEVEASDIPEPVCIRWATLLLWFCVAADRRVRDQATKGLVAITQVRPKVWATLIAQFASVDDEYVLERCFCAAYGALLRSRDAEAERAVAAAAYDVVFADPFAVQNALIRDHARCIVELAAYDKVLPAKIEFRTVRPPYRSEWPLTIPPGEIIARYAKAGREYPKLHLSCLNDDFFQYTMHVVEPYEEIVPKKELGQWILDHVIQDLGYRGAVLASYDEHMLYKYGAGRGRPGWAERIGKKYQWIALSRLVARLTDNAKPKEKERTWEPKATGVPLVYARGRDIDPSLLVRGQQPRRESAVWWLPVDYDFISANGQSNAEWTASSADVPSSERLLQPIAREGGGEWQLLDGYPTWSPRKRAENDDDFESHRQVWTHIRGYLVKRTMAQRVFKWMSKQHFMGRWLVEGAEFDEGYVGEYPWGILFTMYPDRWHSRGGDKKAPARLVPVCNSISSNYEQDAYQDRTVSVRVPVKTFFEDAYLRWDGLSGYRDASGRLVFLDPSVSTPGSSALLVERSYLLDFLRRRDFAIVWAVLGEKIYIGGYGGASSRLEFSRAHLLDQSGTLISSELLTPEDQ